MHCTVPQVSGVVAARRRGTERAARRTERGVHSTHVGLHFSLAQSPLLTPLQEYLVKWNAINQHFLAHKLVPEGGALRPPDRPGLGMDLDPGQIERQTEVLA